MAQTNMRFTFEVAPGNMEETPEGPATAISLDVLSFELEESLNDPFCLSLELISHDADIDFDLVLNHPAVFTICQQGEPAGLLPGFFEKEPLDSDKHTLRSNVCA